MSDADVESSCSCDADMTYESSLVSKPSESSSESSMSNPSIQQSSSALLYNFINYDPFSHRFNSHHTYFSATVLFICRSIGLGFLCMPYAFQQVGVVVGFALCVFAGLTFNYSYTLLCRFRYKVCQIHRISTMPYYSYQNLIENSLALGPRIISSFTKLFKFLFVIMNLALNFGTSCIHTKFVSSVIQELSIDMGITMDTLECNLIYTSLSIFFLLVPSTKYLEPFNIVGHIACSVLLVYICSQMATSDTQIDRMSLIHCEWSSVFRFFGILLFSFVPVVQSLRIEDELIKPKYYVQSSYGLLNISMVLVTNMYFTFGLWGYLTFKYTLEKFDYSILTTMKQTRFLSIVKACFAAHIAFLHQELCSNFVSLLSSTILTEAENAKLKQDKCRSSNEETSSIKFSWLLAATKIVFTSSSYIVAVTVLSSCSLRGRLELIMALVGYAGNAWNVLVFPYLVELCLTHALNGMSARPYVIAKDLCFVLFGLSTFACGTLAVSRQIAVREDPAD